MVSQQDQQLLIQAQMYQQQLQAIMAQKENIIIQSMEIKRALEELEKVKDTDVYKVTGPILIKSEKAAITKELKDRHEEMDAKEKSLEKSEEKIKSRLDEITKKLSSKISVDKK
ncbi:MAG: prefoldin subunit beta [Candidatus Aenigmatarchaeota archaeon]|nr:prefoldin subunit beta [Nanoarchaeota archaeon]